jgi:hypothetical protein
MANAQAAAVRTAAKYAFMTTPGSEDGGNRLALVLTTRLGLPKMTGSGFPSEASF